MSIDQLVTCTCIEDIKKLRPPNKKSIDNHLSQIKEKTKQLKQHVNEEENIRQTLKDLSTTRCEYTKLQSQNIADLKLLKSEIIQKNNTLSSLQSGLMYKNENKINEAIKNLERQLNWNNFTLREEKKIVAEIDSLKRSKKTLALYRTHKIEIDELRAQQTKKRSENDEFYHGINQLRDKEEEKQKRLGFLQRSIKELNSEIDKLEEQKKVLLADFKKQEKDYNVRKDIVRKKKHKQTEAEEEDRLLQQEKITNYIREAAVVSPNPNTDRIQHCSKLINYLQQFTNFNAVLGSSPLPSPSEEFSSFPGPALEIKDHDGAKYFLLKKSNDRCFKEYSANRHSKKNRKFRKKTSNKPLAHSPEIFSLFESVNLPPTSNFCDIYPTIDKLQQLKSQLEKTGAVKDCCKENGSVASSDDICLSDSGYSADGSATCDLSRQVSHRGSTDMNSNSTNLLDVNQINYTNNKSRTVPSSETANSEVEEGDEEESSQQTINKLSLLDDLRQLSLDTVADNTNFEKEKQTEPADLK